MGLMTLSFQSNHKNHPKLKKMHRKMHNKIILPNSTLLIIITIKNVHKNDLLDDFDDFPQNIAGPNNADILK